eukprot:10421-Heterococcus_DN1.PRE.1
MLTTVFKRWDEQYTILPNQQLAKREIRNQRRSGNAVVVMPLLIALSTPKDKIESLRTRLVDYATAVMEPLYGCRAESIEILCKSVIEAACGAKGNCLTNNMSDYIKNLWGPSNMLVCLQCYHVKLFEPDTYTNKLEIAVVYHQKCSWQDNFLRCHTV